MGSCLTPTQILEDPKISFRKRRMRSLDLRGNSNSPLVMMSFKGANLTQKEKHSLEIISSLLADGKSSYLAQNYVESDRPKLSYIESENIELKNGTSVVIHAQMLPKVGIWWLEKNLRKNIDSSCKIMINERNIQKAKNQYLMKLIEKLSTSHGIADYLAEIETNFEDFAFYQKDLEVISHLEVDEVMETCKKYISSSNGLFISLWNRNPIRRPR
jgi:zinc protease